MGKKILFGFVGLVAVLLIIVIAQPSTYRVERAVNIQAPAELVWAEIADFRHWAQWNAWEKVDPSQVTTITGEPGTIGHKSSWVGKDTGSGSMTMTDLMRPTHLAIKLEFVEPFASQAETGLDVTPRGDRAEVIWWMAGENDFMGKAFGLFMNMDQMIGSKYAESLSDLKSIAEAAANKKSAETVAAAEPAAN